MFNFIIRKAYFRETGTMPDIVSHSLAVRNTPQTMQMFAERIEQAHTVSQSTMVGLAGQIIVPNTNDLRQSIIPGGWENRRFSFVLEVTSDSPDGSSGTRYIYTGYTDNNDVAGVANDFAGDTRLFFNSVLAINYFNRIDPLTGVLEPSISVVKNEHLIHPGAMYGINQPQFTQTPGGLVIAQGSTMLRPHDVLKYHSATLKNIDIDTVSMPNGTLYRRDSLSPSNYLSSTAVALTNAYRTCGVDGNNPAHSTSDVFDQAAANIQESGLYGDMFLSPLAMNASLASNGFITWHDLTRHHPEIYHDGVCTISRRRQLANDLFVCDRNNFDPLVNDQSQEAMLARVLGVQIPERMNRNLIRAASIDITNMTLDGSVSVIVRDPHFMTSLPPNVCQEKILALEAAIASQILQDLPINVLLPYSFTLVFDTFGESFGQISLNGSYPKPYPLPSYADSAITPLVSNDFSSLQQMAIGIGTMYQHAF